MNWQELLHSINLEPGLLEICLRLGCAMLIGLVIGTERQYTHRPAGMRTHILVSLGACMVAITGELLFNEYRTLGAIPDPARLSAQVITGVGFLGAGTILREGPNVKGLTTAASLWSVACLGTAAGFGYYIVAVIGMVFIFITLTIFEGIQHRLMYTHFPLQRYEIETEDISTALNQINALAQRYRIEITNIQSEKTSSGFRISFHAAAAGRSHKKRIQQFFEALSTDSNIRLVQQTVDTVNSK